MNNGQKQVFARTEILAGLDRAIDAAYTRVGRSARANWEAIGLRDPSDAVVSVRVTVPTRAQRGSAFLPAQLTARAAQARKLIQPHFAD